ncbi:helix-turn-helix domain-containing protein [Maritimibacter sp. HL-12]|uniref:helix-turn-helix domain-containing protein n=1 Tax=Maritimibacter sp. HL-12 TaxID=1162418 RepID=UPI000A0F3C73|nr:helix-turn-helix transcriptional regulator [Maritimibacter sp. HL-12]SMH58083.1 DNA-binding transcriptional regulator, XRE-family HTH domain [Maritimibacter sp. HL-12]
MKIDAQRLKALITRRGYTNAKLARNLKVSAKSVGRWTKGKSKPSITTIHQIAKELNVSVEVLTGEAPMEDTKRVTTSPRSRVGADVSARTRNAFLIANRRYGVTQTQIIELAPLLFTLIAEGSLDYRRRIIREAEHHIDALNEMANGFSSYLRSDRAEEGLIDEESSIKRRDIFGECVGNDAFEFGYDQPTQNPFFKYLHWLAGALTDKDAVHLEVEEDIHIENVPAFSMFHEEARKIAKGDEKLAACVAQGIVDLGKLPKELRPAEADEARAQWLRQEAQRVQDEASKFLAQFLSTIGGEQDDRP